MKIYAWAVIAQKIRFKEIKMVFDSESAAQNYIKLIQPHCTTTVFYTDQIEIYSNEQVNDLVKNFIKSHEPQDNYFIKPRVLGGVRKFSTHPIRNVEKL